MTTETEACAVHRCFCCGAVTQQTVHAALGDGWSFVPVRNVAACPRHSISCLDINVANIAQAFGWVVDDLYSRPLPITHDVITELTQLRRQVDELRHQLTEQGEKPAA